MKNIISVRDRISSLFSRKSISRRGFTF